jgi:hypothetical protein
MRITGYISAGLHPKRRPRAALTKSEVILLRSGSQLQWSGARREYENNKRQTAEVGSTGRWATRIARIVFGSTSDLRIAMIGDAPQSTGKAPRPYRM